MTEPDQKKVMLIGWDGVPPSLVFEDMLDELPTLKELVQKSNYGPLRSTKPPITIPAWMCMTTGSDPGQLGMYGFRHRQPGDYKRVYIPDSNKIRLPKVWDILGDRGHKVGVIGFPPTYPPQRVNGVLVSGFIAPEGSEDFAYPPSFVDEIEQVVGDYMLDVFYRTKEKEPLMEDLFRMTRKRHELAKHILKSKEWDLFALMEVGTDRLHHGFWKYYDKTHHLYKADNPYEGRFRDYYRLVDQQLGEMVELAPEGCLIMLVSDHGAKARRGAVCVNQWLQEKGLLTLKEAPSGPTEFDDLQIDWKKTKAWAWGGYYSRIFINVEGYESEGVVPPDEYEEFRDWLADEMRRIPGSDGQSWDVEVNKPEQIYEECQGDYPDLMVYFDNLAWRASSSMGHESMYYYENEIGPDDAVHDWDGIYLAHFPGQSESRVEHRNILDIFPTILRFMGYETPSYAKGEAIQAP
jgi:predicted AlkP superfamily phosphohydrolase/phosphomutase